MMPSDGVVSLLLLAFILFWIVLVPVGCVALIIVCGVHVYRKIKAFIALRGSGLAWHAKASRADALLRLVPYILAATLFLAAIVAIAYIIITIVTGLSHGGQIQIPFSVIKILIVLFFLSMVRIESADTLGKALIHCKDKISKMPLY